MEEVAHYCSVWWSNDEDGDQWWWWSCGMWWGVYDVGEIWWWWIIWGNGERRMVRHVMCVVRRGVEIGWGDEAAVGLCEMRWWWRWLYD